MSDCCYPTLEQRVQLRRDYTLMFVVNMRAGLWYDKGSEQAPPNSISSSSVRTWSAKAHHVSWHDPLQRPNQRCSYLVYGVKERLVN